MTLLKETKDDTSRWSDTLRPQIGRINNEKIYVNKKKKTKNGQKININFSKDIQMAKRHKMLNITNDQRKTNQNDSEVSSHTGQNGHHQKIYKEMLERVWRKRKPATLLVGL